MKNIRYDLNSCLRVKWVKERQVVVQIFIDEEIKEMLNFAKKATFFKVKNMGKSRTGFQTTFTKQRDYLLLLLLTNTEMRTNEMMNLRVNQLSEKEIFIENSKGKKDRIIHCSPKIYKEYLKYKRLNFQS